jgi:hypothetical protein
MPASIRYAGESPFSSNGHRCSGAALLPPHPSSEQVMTDLVAPRSVNAKRWANSRRRFAARTEKEVHLLALHSEIPRRRAAASKRSS